MMTVIEWSIRIDVSYRMPMTAGRRLALTLTCYQQAHHAGVWPRAVALA